MSKIEYKTINFSKEEILASTLAIQIFIKQQEEVKNFFKAKLESPDSASDVRQITEHIQDSRRRLKVLKPLLKRIEGTELTIKHQLRDE